ncbi:MAG: serine hydrolase domain-containing protein [Pseudomonadota bacterium]
MPFDPPRSAGGHPRLLLALLTAVLLAVGAVAAVRYFAPEPSAAGKPLPPRPPLVVVEDLPRLAQRLDRSRFTGAVLVARGDKVVFRQAYGQTEGRPLALNDRFRLASVSKQFTAAAILTLQDKGVLSVDDPLCKWIDPCPEAWAPIRLHHLLSHTSGVPDLMSQANWGQRRIRPTTPDQLTAASAMYRLQFQPGTKVKYDNAGFNLLGVVIERASGMAFADYLRTALFEPLGMKDTGYDDGADHGIIMGYANLAGGLAPQPDANPSVVFAAGGLYSTLDDLLVWERALHRGYLLSPESYADMIRDHAPADTGPERGRVRRDWGYGLFANRLGTRVSPGFDERQIYHTGSWSGFRNLITYQPDADVTVIVLSNNFHQTAEVFLISQQAMAEALGHDFPTGPAPR